MNLNELIAQLEAIRVVHGGEIAVYHHDDYREFLVQDMIIEESRFDPGEYNLSTQTPIASFIPKRLVFVGDDGEESTIWGQEAIERATREQS
jgi:hypothetical protein